MVGDAGEVDEVVFGTAVKVLAVAPTGDSFIGILRNGNTARVTIRGAAVLEADDVVLVNESGYWEQLPPEAWTEEAAIVVVRAIHDDRLVIEGPLGFRLVPSYGALVEVGNTVEYADGRGVLSVVSQTPLRRGIDFDTEPIDRFRIDTSEPGPTFADFGGYPHVIEHARELIETQLQRKANLDEIGAKPIKGILFTGPPGTGKTMLARIIAQETDAAFFVISGPEIVSKWLGDSESSLRQVFDAAEQAERAIIFFDEIDSVAERRQGDTHEASKRLVAQFLTEMDGFEERAGSNVIVIAATNRVHDIDPALRRPGRFDWQIDFGMPTDQDRYEILVASCRRLKTHGELPFGAIAARSAGWSAAKLTSIWTEAALLAAKADRRSIADLDFVEGFERVATRPQIEEARDA